MPKITQGKRRLAEAAIGAALLVVTGCLFGLWYAGSRGLSDPLSRAARAYEEGHWTTATELARRALNSRKDDPAALRLLARSSARLGRDDAAIAIYTRRLEQRQIEAEDQFLLGLAYQRRGQADAAARAWKKVIDDAQSSPHALEELARVHLQGHRSEEAIPIAERLIEQPGWEARGLMMLGTIRAALTDFSSAALSFRRAIALDPNEVDKSANPAPLRKLIARTFLREGQPALARTVLQPIVAGGPDPEAAWLLSRTYLQEGDKAAAQSALAQAGSYRADNPLEPEPSPYVGEARCEKCHAAIFRDSLASRHTQTYYRGAQLDQLPLPDRPLPDPDDPAVTHMLGKRDGALWEETKVGDEVHRAVIEYAFGTSDRYLTMVSRDTRGGYHIVRMSYYNTADGRGWDRSTLDTSHPSHGRTEDFQGEAIGIRDGLARCLYCHLTNPRTGREPGGPETADRAIGCERCHGPGGNHVAAVGAGIPDSAIINPAAASPEAVTTKQCNDCHILNRNFRNGDLSEPGWIRSQGVGWALSRCNTESAGAFGCVTCHDPHKSARAITREQYEAKCLTCHAATDHPSGGDQPGSTARARTAPRATTCPVNSSKGCIECHMPRVRIDSIHMKLTDHHIRADRPHR